MSKIIPLETKELPESCFVFKHSTKCPISTSAADAVKASEFDKPLYWVNVIEQRELSNWIAGQYGVEHQSPQLIEISGGAAINSWSHQSINKHLA